MGKHSTVHIVSVLDNNYAQHLSVVYVSLLANLAEERKAEFHIIESELTELNKIKLNSVAAQYGSSIHYYKVNKQSYKDVSLSEHLTQATYYRIAIPDLIQHLDKVIYLDCDLLVLQDISKMYDVSLDNFVLGAVVNPGGNQRLKELNIPAEFLYFNAGVLIMNLKKWREQRVTEKTMNYITENADKLLQHDQDALNAVLFNQWMQLDLNWNVQTSMLRKTKPEDPFIEAEQVRKAVKTPFIIHFTGAIKPWHFHDLHPYKKQYYRYLKLTPWKKYKTPKTFEGLTKKCVKMLVPEHVLAKLKS